MLQGSDDGAGRVESVICESGVIGEGGCVECGIGEGHACD